MYYNYKLKFILNLIIGELIMYYKFTEEEKENFISICNSAISMADAARQLGMHFNTFSKFAKQFGCYNTNQGHKGMKMKPYNNCIDTQDILNGLYPNYQTYKLKCRLIREGYKEDKCELCGWDMKRDGDEFTPCELHHKNGNSHDHSFNNLILLCPNCHSLTENYRAKNIKFN